MSAILTFSQTLETITCYKCGMLFAVPDNFKRRLLNTHETFHCPAGHEQHFVGKSEAERLRDQLAAEKHKAEQARASADSAWNHYNALSDEKAAVQRRLSATQGVVTRHKRKIAKGKCPCCSHAFKDLAAHMKNRHPKWDPSKEAEVRVNA